MTEDERREMEEELRLDRQWDAECEMVEASKVEVKVVCSTMVFQTVTVRASYDKYDELDPEEVEYEAVDIAGNSDFMSALCDLCEEYGIDLGDTEMTDMEVA